MSQFAFGITPFSARVDLWLECEHGRVPLAQVGPTFVVPASPTYLPPCLATVVVSVDGREFPRQVKLVNGMALTGVDAMVLEDDLLPF